MSAALTGACASSAGTTAGGASASATAPARVDHSRIDSLELQSAPYPTVYQTLIATRSDWFRPVGGTKSISGARATSPVVGIFVDGSRQPKDAEFLRTLVPRDVRLIRHLSASESVVVYGPEWAWGAIVVTLAR